MKEEMIPELPSMSVFPDPADGITRAGTPAEQVAAQDRAWTILETYATPSGLPGAWLANGWLGDNGLRVQLLHHAHTLDGQMKPFADALRRWGIDSLLGTNVSPDAPRPSAVWRIPAEAGAIGTFMFDHYAGFHILFPGDLSFALLANDGDYVAFAAPESLLREALPPESIGNKATTALVAELERVYQPGAIDRVLAHYEPFMLAR